MKTLVTIGIPTYNRANTLIKTLESVLKQDYSNLEIIVSDNASNDNTQAVCQKISISEPRIKYIRQTQNRGADANFKFVMESANGDFFMWLADDDSISPSYISRCVSILESDPTVSLVSGWANLFHEGRAIRRDAIVNVIQDSPKERVLYYHSLSHISSNSVFYGLMRHSQLCKIPITQTVGSDWLFISQVAFLGKIKTLEDIYINRDITHWANIEETLNKIVSNADLPRVEALEPNLHGLISTFMSIAWESSVYAPLGDIDRFSLAHRFWKQRCSELLRLYQLNYYKELDVIKGFRDYVTIQEKNSPIDSASFNIPRQKLNQLLEKLKDNSIKTIVDNRINPDDNWQLTTPVAFIIFNRPDTTQKVFETIRQAKPPKLLVIADGPRQDKLGEAEKCAQTRAIIDQVDWECEVLTNYSEVNLGCRQRITSGLDWVFEQVEEAIILEDDCLPDSTFYRYCQELLSKYRDNEQIMMISGDNFQFGRNKTEFSYYFSHYSHVWGWATWRRAWQKYDDSMQSWPELKQTTWLENILENKEVALLWSKVLENLYNKVFDTWDFTWQFSIWANNGLTILPNVNLISNIGFGSGTNNQHNQDITANLPTESLNFPLKHPESVIRNIKADNFTPEIQFFNPKKQKSVSMKTTEKCKVCGSDSPYFATAKMLQKYDVKYYQCSHCGFVQTEEPYWLNEAYSEAIAVTDVGLVYRNQQMAEITAKLLFNCFDHEAKFLDYGGGYGLFVRLMRDQGFDFYWQDKYCQNIFAKGFEFNKKNKPDFLLVTAFELCEHLINPSQEIDSIMKLAPNFLFHTLLLPEHNPKPDKWWYYNLIEGQHISIYTRKSLEILAEKYDLKLYSDNEFIHLLTTNKNLPENLFELIKHNKLNSPNKKSLMSQDFTHVVNRYVLKNISVNSNEPNHIPEPKSPKILIDGVFFQLYKTGIARVWQSLLEQWANTDFANHILVLDRANTAPKINGIRYRTIHPYDYNNTEGDSQLLQQICDEEGAELFISSYYTTPIDTPSVFMAYDMIPEVMGGDLNSPMWREKHKGINHAASFIAISENTALDINKYFPEIPLSSITVAHCGVNPLFSPASPQEIANFKYKYGIQKPYFLLGALGGYKNSILFMQAFAQLANKTGFDIMATGAGVLLPPEWRQLTAGCTFHGLQLTDEELRIAYSGAVALVYPSKYEGFGMPVIEAMACGCPVITTPNSSLPEVAGEAALYVQDDDIEGMADALCEVQKPSLRRKLIAAGLQQSQKFSWSKMAEIVKNALFNAILPPVKLGDTNYIIFPHWQTEEEQLMWGLNNIIKALVVNNSDQKVTLLIDINNFNEEDAELLVSGVAMNLMLEEEIDISEALEISFVKELSENQWSKLLPKINARIATEFDNLEAINAVNADSLLTLTLTGNNYLMFPNWQTDEETLGLELMAKIKDLAMENEGNLTCLLIDYTGFNLEDANLLLSSVVMNLMLEEEMDISESINISFLGNYSDEQWQKLTPFIKEKITLVNETLPENLLI